MNFYNASPQPTAECSALTVLLDTAGLDVNVDVDVDVSNQESIERYIELTSVQSPLSSMHPSVAKQILGELYQNLVLTDKHEMGIIERADSELQHTKNDLTSKITIEENSGEVYDNDHDFDDSLKNNNFTSSFTKACVLEERSLNHTVGERQTVSCGSFSSSQGGIHVKYTQIRDVETIQRCLTSCLPSINPDALPVHALVLCVVVSGMPQSYATSLHICSLPQRLKEASKLLQQLPSISSIDLMLTSLLLDDESIKTSLEVEIESGRYNDIDGMVLRNDIKQKSKSGFKKFKVSSIPKKLVKGRKKKSKKLVREEEDFNMDRATALISASAPTSDLTRMIADQMQILSLAENDMIFQQYSLLHRQVGKRDRVKGGKSPIRRTRSAKGNAPKLQGFDNIAPIFDRQSNDSSQMFFTGIRSVTSDVSSTTATSSVTESSSSSSSFFIPMLSGPTRDSMSSRRQLRRMNKLSATRSAMGQKGLTWTNGFNNINSSSDVFQQEIHKDEASSVVGTSNFDPFLVEDDIEKESNPFLPFGEVSSISKSGDSDIRVASTEKYDQDTANEANMLDASKVSHPAASFTNNATRLVVSIALNEDLAVSYRQSNIQSCSIEGVIQVQVKSESSAVIPFALYLTDPARHVQIMQENKKYANDTSNEIQAGSDARYKFVVAIPTPDQYFPILKYKCSEDLRPVPIRVQTRVRLSGSRCRVAIQISSNPTIETVLSDLSIQMPVSKCIKGESLATQPPGGVWNNEKRNVLWCVEKLGQGEKFQLQAQFQMTDIAENLDEQPVFPILIRCQCLYSQLSQIELDAGETSTAFPVDLSVKLARRFRLSHKEK